METAKTLTSAPGGPNARALQCGALVTNPRVGEFSAAVPDWNRALLGLTRPRCNFLMSAEERIAQLKLQLPPRPKPVGVYKPVLVIGGLAYASGHGPIIAEGVFITGRVGAELDLAAGKAAARQTGLTMLASLRAVLGNLDRIERLVRTFGMVNCTAEFTEHPEVINGCSELFAEIWGPENGIGARSAIGVGSLPKNIPVEIEAVFALT